MRAVLATALVLALFGGGCGHTKRSSTSAPTTSSTAPATTSTPSTSPSPTARTAVPDEVAQHLYAAWKADDRAAAREWAEPAAIDVLFARKWQAVYTFVGCRAAGTGRSVCSYHFQGGGGTIDFFVARGGSGERVQTVEFGSV